MPGTVLSIVVKAHPEVYSLTEVIKHYLMLAIGTQMEVKKEIGSEESYRAMVMSI